MPATLSGRILTRLMQAEACELNPHYRDDLQIARLTVLHAARGDAVLCSPHVLATYEILGVHPDRVWTAIQARREALGYDKFLGWKLPPKKPPQAVGRSQQKLWFEKRSAEAHDFGARQQLVLRDQTISVPMAAPSIAALYPKSDAPSSAKKRQFSLEELKQLIHYSGAPHPTRALTIAALDARGPWPNEDGPATAILCISLKGMMLEGGVCKRTVQRRIKRACNLGFWRRTREANSWSNCPKCGSTRESSRCPNDKCMYKGSTKNRGEFTRPYTYEFDLAKFMAAKRCREIHSEDWRSYSEYKQASRAEQSNVTPIRRPSQPTPPPDNLPPTTAAPKRPAAEHRSTERRPRELTSRERAKLIQAITELRRGITGKKGVDGLWVDFSQSDPRYVPPHSLKDAIAEACKLLLIPIENATDALKLAGFQLQE